MTEEEWLAETHVMTLFKYLREKKAVRKHRLFACGCCRQLVAWFPDALLMQALERAERFADGELSDSTMDKWRQQVNRIKTAGQESNRITPATRVSWMVSAVCLSSHYSGYTEVWKTLVYNNEMFGDEFAERGERVALSLLRDVFGNPFRTITFSDSWRTDTAMSLARTMYDSRDFGAMPILADALQDAGCDSEDVLNHCRSEGPHVRGCWVVDLVLGKA